MNISNFKIKDRKKIDILKYIPLCMVNKYWSNVEDDFLDTIQEGYNIHDTTGVFIAKVLKFIPEKKLALLELPNYINYFDLIVSGITMDRIVFDNCQKNIGLNSNILKLDDKNLL